MRQVTKAVRTAIENMDFRRTFRVCLIVLVAFFGPCDGVTLFVNSKYPPPPSFITSLYRAPQTYDRGKSSRAPSPFIIISKVRPCYHLESARHFGLVKQGSLVRPQQGHPLTTPSLPTRPAWAHSEINQLLPAVWSATKAPLSSQEFKGKWQIIQPVLKEELNDRVIKYNKDGTRIVHETLYNYHTRDSQIAIKGIKGIPEKGVKVHDKKPAATSRSTVSYAEKSTVASATQTAAVPATPPKLTLTVQYHVPRATAQTLSASTVIHISTTQATTPKPTASTAPTVPSTEVKTAHTLGPIAVASSYFVHDSSKAHEATKKPTRPEGQTVTSTLAPVSVVTSYVVQDPPTSTAPPKTSLVSKLGGGAQNIFNHIFGGLLNGRHTKDKNSDTLGHGNGTESSPAWIKEETLPALQESSQRNASFHHHLSEHITKKLPNSFWTQLQFLQEQLEKSNSKGTVSSAGFTATTPISATTSDAEEPASSTLFSHDEAAASSTSSNGFDFSSTPLDPWPLDQSPQGDQGQEPTGPMQLPTETSAGEEVEYSDFTPWTTSDELVTDMPEFSDSTTALSPMFYGKMNFPTSCPDCESVTKREEHSDDDDDDALATSTSGWRPLRRPVPFRSDPPRAPAPAPLSIHQWLNSAWNDTSDWWAANGHEQAMSSTDFEPESTTEKSVRKWFQKVAASNPIPRLPSQTPKDFDVTTYKPLLGLSPIQWLFGSDYARADNSTNATDDAETYEDVTDDSHDIDIETRIKEGQEIVDLPTSRIKPPKAGSKPSDAMAGRESSSAQLLKHAQIVSQSGSINASHVNEETHYKNNHSEYRLASENNGKVEKPAAEPFPNKNVAQTLSPAEAIKEMGKFYTKLKVGLGLPLPLDIIEPLITMKYESMKAQDRLNDARLQNKSANYSSF